MENCELIRTWQVDWVRDPSSGVRKGVSRLSIYRDPSGREGGVLIRYTDFGRSYSTLQNGHLLGRGHRISAMTSMNRRVVFHVNEDRLFATPQNLRLLRFLERMFPVMARRLRPLLLCPFGRAAWSATPL